MCSEYIKTYFTNKVTIVKFMSFTNVCFTVQTEPLQYRKCIPRLILITAHVWEQEQALPYCFTGSILYSLQDYENINGTSCG